MFDIKKKETRGNKAVLTFYYANTLVKDIRESYAIKEICRRLQAMQAIT
jgi:hypothetical protein